MERALADAVFAAKKGEVLAPLNAAAGYQIVRVVEDPVVATKPFEEIQDTVRYRLQHEKKAQEMERLTGAVKPNAG